MLKDYYYSNDASLAELVGASVAVIGYGVQGRAFAANLRDSGVSVHVGNILDEYREKAVADGHRVLDIPDAARAGRVILLLIPDEAHKAVFEESIAPNIQPGATLIVAHGHSLLHGNVRAVAGTDLAMLAPRMYGDPIRQYFLNGQGAPAYLDIVADRTGRALQRVLAIAEAVGFTRAGVMTLDHRQETILDLFQEQFIAPALVDLVETGFRVLVEQGFDPRAAFLEVYGSGEIGKMMLDGAEIGLDEVIRLHSSPTCQVGYHIYRDRLLPPAIADKARKILASIQNGEFTARLKAEAEADYAMLQTANAACREKEIAQVHLEVRAALKFPSDGDDNLYQAMPGVVA